MSGDVIGEMKRIRDTGLKNPRDSIYSSEECHVHAIAAARLFGTSEHEYGFLVITDRDHVWWRDENGIKDDIPAPVHVCSLHEIDGQVIARDAFGDRLEQDAMEEAAEIFQIDHPGCERYNLGQLLALTDGHEPQWCGTGFENPLYAVTESSICEALREPSVTAPLCSEPLNTCEEEYVT